MSWHKAIYLLKILKEITAAPYVVTDKRFCFSSNGPPALFRKAYHIPEEQIRLFGSFKIIKMDYMHFPISEYSFRSKGFERLQSSTEYIQTFLIDFHIVFQRFSIQNRFDFFLFDDQSRGGRKRPRKLKKCEQIIRTFNNFNILLPYVNYSTPFFLFFKYL